MISFLKLAIPITLLTIVITPLSGQTVKLTSKTSPASLKDNQPAPVITGAERMEVYLPLLKGKKIGVFANQTSRIGPAHLIDTLLKRGVDIKKIFGPEHGFRGVAD